MVAGLCDRMERRTLLAGQTATQQLQSGGLHDELLAQRRREADLLFHRAGITFTLYGDGILIQGSSDKSVLQSTADNNEPYSGIAIITGVSDHPARGRAGTTSP